MALAEADLRGAEKQVADISANMMALRSTMENLYAKVVAAVAVGSVPCSGGGVEYKRPEEQNLYAKAGWERWGGGSKQHMVRRSSMGRACPASCQPFYTLTSWALAPGPNCLPACQPPLAPPWPSPRHNWFNAITLLTLYSSSSPLPSPRPLPPRPLPP